MPIFLFVSGYIYQQWLTFGAREVRGRRKFWDHWHFIWVWCSIIRNSCSTEVIESWELKHEFIRSIKETIWLNKTEGLFQMCSKFIHCSTNNNDAVPVCHGLKKNTDHCVHNLLKYNLGTLNSERKSIILLEARGSWPSIALRTILLFLPASGHLRILDGRRRLVPH